VGGSDNQVMVRLGAHMSIAGGVDRAIERGASIGCEAVQIFLKNQLQWRGRPLRAEEVERFRALQRASGISVVFAHGSYLINLAATDGRLWRRSICALLEEIDRAEALGVPFIVVHPGAHLGAGEAAGLKRVARSLDEVFGGRAASRVKIALETTAGQGTNLGYRFEQLGEIFQLVQQPGRLAVCVDTCHVFAAGYDIASARGYAQMLRAIERCVGVERVVAFHLNDSGGPPGGRLDRHAHIGRGRIGLAGFRRLLRDERWAGLPMVLETPKGRGMREDVRNLRVLRALL
jgi:deoxyribonuclease-4